MANPEQHQTKINDLELAVRTIEDMLPDIPTSQLRKWQSIFKTALIKTEKELTNTMLHTCQICFFQEYGYRDELPSSWYSKGDAQICFQHDYSDAEKLLKDAGHEVDAFFPPEIPVITPEALKVQMNHLPEPPSEQEQTLEELMAIL